MLTVGVTGCSAKNAGDDAAWQSSDVSSTRFVMLDADDVPRNPFVRAQGKILPAGGVIQIAGLPGSRIDAVLVDVDQPVTKGQKLVDLSAERLKAAEYELALLKQSEANSQADAKRGEAELQIESAELAVVQAKGQLNQAVAQQQLAVESESSLDIARDQIRRLELLRDNPLTRPLVGSIEVDQKRAELSQAELKFKQSKLTAEQAVRAAELGVDIAEKRLAAAVRSRELVDLIVPTESLDKQLSILKLQQSELLVTSPVDGFVLSVSTKRGEMVAQFPMMEIANLDRMIVLAEVPEASVSRVAVGANAMIRSAAFSQDLTGKVTRIDRIIGKPQLGLPNPLEKTDFRTVPVRIEIDAKFRAAAANLIRLQVDVEIQAAPSNQA